MKKQLLVTGLILNTIFSFAQPTIQWQKSFGGSDDDVANSIKQTLDGGYVTAGYSFSNDGDLTSVHGASEYWIVKLDNSGVIEWQKSYGGSSFDEANCIQQTNDGGYIIAGSSKSSNGDVIGNHGNADYWIVKIDNLGNIQWQKTLGGSGNDIALSVMQNIDNSYIVAGYSNSNNGDVIGNHGYNDYWIVKIDNLGNIQWQKTLGGSGEDYATSIKQTSNGGFIVAGSSASNDGDITTNHGYEDYWIVKIDSLGIIEWQKSIGSSYIDQLYSIIETASGDYVLAGHSGSNDGDVNGNHGAYDYWIVKIDNSGVIQWQKNLGGTNYDSARSIEETSDGGYIVTGYSKSNDMDITQNNGDADYWIVKLDNTGTIEWEKSLGASDIDVAYSIQETYDGGYIVAGESYSNNGYQDYWIVKLSGTATELTESINDNTLNIYPNPTNGTFTLEAATEGIYSIVNELGQIIQEIKLNDSNNYTVSINNLNTGIYFIVGYNKEKMIHQKIVITK